MNLLNLPVLGLWEFLIGSAVAFVICYILPFVCFSKEKRTKDELSNLFLKVALAMDVPGVILCLYSSFFELDGEPHYLIAMTPLQRIVLCAAGWTFVGDYGFALHGASCDYDCGLGGTLMQ
jgi:hypothetical protein